MQIFLFSHKIGEPTRVSSLSLSGRDDKYPEFFVRKHVFSYRLIVVVGALGASVTGLEGKLNLM